MNIKKYMPTIPQVVQITVAMVVLTTFGIVGKGREMLGKITGR